MHTCRREEEDEKEEEDVPTEVPTEAAMEVAGDGVDSMSQDCEALETVPAHVLRDPVLRTLLARLDGLEALLQATHRTTHPLDQVNSAVADTGHVTHQNNRNTVIT